MFEPKREDEYKLHPGALLNCREEGCACNGQPGICECEHACGDHLRPSPSGTFSSPCNACPCEKFKRAAVQTL